MSDDDVKLDVLERMAEGFNRHDLDATMSLATHFVSGDRGVSERTLTGTTVDGERLEVRGCDLWEFDGDQVVRKDSFWKIVES